MAVKVDFGAMSIEERMDLTDRIFTIYPRLKTVLDSMTECHQKSKRSREPRCLFIYGPSGCGKTTVAKFYCSKFPPNRNEDGVVIPVLFSIIFAPAAVKSVASGLLRSIGDPYADRGTVASMTFRLYEYIKNCGVELIMLDEFQHLLDRESNKILYSSSNWLKNLINETGVPVILFGMPGSEKIFTANDQLERRFLARLEIKAFGGQTSRELDEFRTFLKAVDEKLPFLERSNLADSDTALRFYIATKGVISAVMRIIKTATEIALRLKTEKITLEILARAYDKEIGLRQQSRENPFKAA